MLDFIPDWGFALAGGAVFFVCTTLYRRHVMKSDQVRQVGRFPWG